MLTKFYMKQKIEKQIECNCKGSTKSRAASLSLNSTSTLLEPDLKFSHSYKWRKGNKMPSTFTDSQKEHMIHIISRLFKTVCEELHFLLVPTRGLPLTSDSCNRRNMVIAFFDLPKMLMKTRFTTI